MNLERYQQKRDFQHTPEPQAKQEMDGEGPIFVVQHHQASHLHYDFRLQIEGALASWAIPKGPSMNPQDRRLAIRVEDHPLAYAEFEGVIPEGNYGAGTVQIWDHGIFLADGDPATGLTRGELHFQLEGSILHGGFTLLRLPRAKGTEWLLMKRRDAFADPHWTIERTRLYK